MAWNFAKLLANFGNLALNCSKLPVNTVSNFSDCRDSVFEHILCGNYVCLTVLVYCCLVLIFLCSIVSVSYTHLRAHETRLDLV